MRDKGHSKGPPLLLLCKPPTPPIARQRRDKEYPLKFPPLFEKDYYHPLISTPNTPFLLLVVYLSFIFKIHFLLCSFSSSLSSRPTRLSSSTSLHRTSSYLHWDEKRIKSTLTMTRPAAMLSISFCLGLLSFGFLGSSVSAFDLHSDNNLVNYWGQK